MKKISIHIDNVTNITEVSRDRWLSVAKACSWATCFHTPYWYELRAPRQEYAALEVTFSDGESALIPLVKTKRLRGLFTSYYSSPGGNYGGWISETTLDKNHIRALLSVLLSKKNLVFRVNPFDPLSSDIFQILKSKENFRHLSYKFTDDFTQTLDLTRGMDEIFRDSSGSFRRGVKKAEKEGVVIEAARSWEEWEQYYALYQSSLDRWRGGGLKTRSVYPLEFFRRLYDNRTGHEVLWLAKKDGKALSGMLCFYWNRHAVYWHGAVDARYFNLHPNNLLFQSVIFDAARQGFEIFDLNPSGGYAGTETFKERLGAHRKQSPVLTATTPLRSLISRVRSIVRRSP